MENLEITDSFKKCTYHLLLSECLFAIFECSKIAYLLLHILHFLLLRLNNGKLHTVKSTTCKLAACAAWNGLVY